MMDAILRRAVSIVLMNHFIMNYMYDLDFIYMHVFQHTHSLNNINTHTKPESHRYRLICMAVYTARQLGTNIMCIDKVNFEGHRDPMIRFRGL
jgi:hypothetical protein